MKKRTMNTVVIGGRGSEDFAKKLARRLRLPYKPVRVGFFPDGELKMRIPPNVRDKDIILVYSMQPNPDEVLIESLFAAGACRQLGAKTITLVMPYLGFMRQDKMFHPGEAVSNRIAAEMLGRVNRLVTMDPHLHRISSLKQIFRVKTTTLTANNILANHIRNHHHDSIIIGPDEESSQWAAAIAKKARVPFVILKKKRYTAQKVRIKLTSDIPLERRNVVLVDDIISTGHTMIEPIKQLKRKKVKSVTCIAVHGVFALNALKKLRKLGAKVESTNTIANKVAVIDVTEAFAKVL